MGDDQSELFAGTLDELPSVLTILQGYSEVSPLQHCPSVQSVLIGGMGEYITSQLEANIAPNGGITYSTSGNAGRFGSVIDTTCLGQRVDMAAYFSHPSWICEPTNIDLVTPRNALATHANHAGVSSATGFHDSEYVNILSIQRLYHEVQVDRIYFPPSENWLNDYGLVLPQRTLRDHELPSPTLVDKRVPDSTTGFPPHKIPYGSFEIRRESLKKPWPSPKPIKGRPTTSFVRKVTSSKPVTEHRCRYLCKICGEGFAQPQGVRRHHLEKHEPRLCPYCHTFKWARRYVFKKHLKEAHPEVDPEAAMLYAARRGTV
ncbi:hypothetical protein EDB86DRAFT_3243564 [Lactarius hatsudake]|nr:hypothetical protein EDB86DRAFT_3243564 [Lactarius hatsudake]